MKTALIAAGLATFAQSAAFAAEPAPVASPDAAAKPPNLLFIFPDQWRGQALGFLGQEPVKTPALDRLASQGMVLTHTMSNTPICVPFRTMLMTGAYPHSNGVLCNCYGDKTPRTPNPDCRWWSDVLNDKGYELGMVGKWHIPPPGKSYQGKPVGQKDHAWVSPESRHHFKYWFHLNGNNHSNPRYWDAAANPSDVKHTQKWSPIFEADRIIDFLKNSDGKVRDASKPFALVWSVNPPHMPYNTAPQEYRKPYESLDIEAHCKQYPNIPAANTRWGKYYRNNIKGYYSQMTGVDAQIGRVLDTLKELNLENDTIVIFTSDHGDCLGRHNEISKSNPYQESVSIPCIIRWPGKIKPRRDDVLFNPPDYYPTMLSLAGFKASIPGSVEGTDHASLLLGGDAVRPTSQLYCMQGYTDPSMGERGVRTHTHTMVLKQKAADQPFNITLYDNIKDPFQMTNIAAQQPQLVKQLIEKELRPWLERTRDPWLKKTNPFPAQ